MFLLLGERIGVIHIASFWRYRFAKPEDSELLPVEEIFDIHDYEVNLNSVEASVWGRDQLPIQSTPAASA